MKVLQRTIIKKLEKLEKKVNVLTSKFFSFILHIKMTVLAQITYHLLKNFTLRLTMMITQIYQSLNKNKKAERSIFLNDLDQ